MADNKKFAGVDGSYTYATDEIGGVDYPFAKLTYGPLDTATVVRRADSATEGPLPVNAYQATDFILAAGLALTPKFGRKQLTADAAIVDAVASKKIRVLAMTINADTANDDLDVRDDIVTGTILMRFVNIPLGLSVLPFNPVGWFETTVGKSLFGDITLAGTGINVSVVYVEV